MHLVAGAMIGLLLAALGPFGLPIMFLVYRHWHRVNAKAFN
jgi:Na+/H+-translocating membrane pyrophosphatase